MCYFLAQWFFTWRIFRLNASFLSDMPSRPKRDQILVFRSLLVWKIPALTNWGCIWTKYSTCKKDNLQNHLWWLDLLLSFGPLSESFRQKLKSYLPLSLLNQLLIFKRKGNNKDSCFKTVLCFALASGRTTWSKKSPVAESSLVNSCHYCMYVRVMCKPYFISV